ncbi:uncharacterized protein LOC116264478 [Nymphaea colorata]|nr:uncharacterized protein LOC116264478 [Nymphaea colorata]
MSSVDEHLIFIESDATEEDEGRLVECRICQEEEERFNLEAPCGCSGSAKYAHRKCVQRWCNEKGNTVCEICCQPYESGYTVNVQEERYASLEISEEFVGERVLAGDDEDYFERNTIKAAAACRSAAIMLMALLLLRHALSVVVENTQEDATLFCMFVLVRAGGFLLPCYLMARALNILQNRRQRRDRS